MLDLLLVICLFRLIGIHYGLQVCVTEPISRDQLRVITEQSLHKNDM